LKFSLLICVYAKENPQYFSQCLDSVMAQTVLPDEAVIVKDGPLTAELEQVLENFRFKNTNIVALPENVTQGPGRAAGVAAAQNELIAVMDSDDICLPDRFEKQLEMFRANPELCLIGGQAAEFRAEPGDMAVRRAVPVSHADIIRFAKLRNPFNSMTVMFRRGEALKAGNYRYFPWFEDYDLWARMIKNGAKCANHPDALVYARVGAGMYGRRRGRTYIRSEWRMQKTLRDLELISRAELLRNVLARIPVRILPPKWLSAVYNTFARRR